MKRLLFIVLWITIQTNIALACDVCGTGLSNSDLGILTNSSSNFLRVGLTSLGFESEPQHETLIKDRLLQLELIGRFRLSEKLRLTGRIPYAHNTRQYEDEALSTKGLSDIQLLIGYIVIDSTIQGSNIYFDITAGIKLPTGRYNEDLHEQNLPENFNVGRGNIATMTQLNFVWSKNQFGLAANSSFQLNSNSSSGYHFGNQFSTSTTLYKSISNAEYTITPSINLNYENIIIDSYANDNPVPGTGGQGFFMGLGCNFNFNKILLGFNGSLPLTENFSGGEVNARAKSSIQLSYIL